MTFFEWLGVVAAFLLCCYLTVIVFAVTMMEAGFSGKLTIIPKILFVVAVAAWYGFFHLLPFSVQIIRN